MMNIDLRRGLDGLTYFALGCVVTMANASCGGNPYCAPEDRYHDDRGLTRGCRDDTKGEGSTATSSSSSGEGSTDPTGSGMATSGTTPSGTTVPTTGSTQSSQGETDGEQKACGNGVLEDGEECDDGNTEDADACRSTCVKAKCGDGVVWPDKEECDDGDEEDDDACLPTCVVGKCGDGVIWEGVEYCDDGNGDDGDDCPSTCIPATCGDGHLKMNAESCDDGNNMGGDGCDPMCAHEYIMFATHGTHLGNVGSKAMANELCQGEAEAAGLTGNYVAWLSSGEMELAGGALPLGEPLRRTDGALIVDAAEKLTLGFDTSLMAPVNLDAEGNSVEGFAWTGTLSSGAAWDNCLSWTDSSPSNDGVVGVVNAKDARWTRDGHFKNVIFTLDLSSCDVQHHLYCFRKKDD